MTFLPIVGRELRVASRRKATYWLRPAAALGVMLIFLCAVLSDTYGTVAERAKEVFEVTSALVLGGCLIAGVFQTADCLCSEKRDGTLGLLFLTDLRGYDVVLGKLVSGSLGASYGLLSILPVLALPLLMGGVTVGEFWRVVLVLLAGLFLSLSVGMLASAVTRETRQALALTGFVVLVLSGVLPAVYASVKIFLPHAAVPVRGLMWPCLGYAYRNGLAEYYDYRPNRHEYWGSLLTVLGIGVFCLLLASVIIPRVWQERGRKSSGGRGLWSWLRFRSAQERRRLRAALLRYNPYYWLTVRDRLPRIGAWLMFLLLLPLWLAFFSAAYLQGRLFSEPFEFAVFTTFAISLVLKFMLVAEASRRLCDDRQSGALELMLVTPLTERRIIAGQRLALVRQFWLPFLVVLGLYAAMYWLCDLLESSQFHDSVTPVMMLGNAAGLFVDFYVLGWVGMWAGLRARHHTGAILGSLLRVLVIPWLVYLLMGFSGMLDGTDRQQPVVYSGWFAFGAVNGLFWAWRARRGLRKQFRAVTAGVAGKKRRRRAVPPALQPAAA